MYGKCAWCHKTGSMAIHSLKFGRLFCNRSHFASWKFYRQNYSAPVFDIGALLYDLGKVLLRLFRHR